MENDLQIKLSKILNKPLKNISVSPSKLFHYTRNEIKEKIVGENSIELKLSRVEDFLDRNEGLQILEPYYHACGILYDEKSIDENFYKMLMGIRQQDLIKDLPNYWIFCFSKSGSSSFLKRRYAPNDGWVLHFDVTLWDHLCIDFSDRFSVKFLDVEYSFEKMVNKFKATIYKCYEAYKESSNDNRDELIRGYILQWLKENGLSYKSRDYKLEEEVRLIFMFDSGFSWWENEERTIKLEASVNGNKPSLKIVLDRKYLTFQTQELLEGYETKLNKQIMSAKEIRNALRKNG